ncbi:MAG TPA: hypothetical protein VG013_29605 [Gemmataceae bacterium]|nr:hypothetical protein [Gemmataceae bacterium]
MLRCRYCRHLVRGERDRAGARCPRCREPLYERSEAPKRAADQPEAGESLCAAHTRNVAVGTCQRCGNFMCAVCRTRWRQTAICTACAGRALESRETAPEEARVHLRQAMLALLFGIAAWVVTLVAVVVIVLGIEGDEKVGMLVLGSLLLFGSPLLSVLGIGQGAAAVRARGDHMILATCGLLLSALQAGAVLGLLLLSTWNS